MRTRDIPSAMSVPLVTPLNLSRYAQPIAHPHPLGQHALHNVSHDRAALASPTFQQSCRADTATPGSDIHALLELGNAQVHLPPLERPSSSTHTQAQAAYPAAAVPAPPQHSHSRSYSEVVQLQDSVAYEWPLSTPRTNPSRLSHESSASWSGPLPVPNPLSSQYASGQGAAGPSASATAFTGRLWEHEHHPQLQQQPLPPSQTQPQPLPQAYPYQSQAQWYSSNPAAYSQVRYTPRLTPPALSAELARPRTSEERIADSHSLTQAAYASDTAYANPHSQHDTKADADFDEFDWDTARPMGERGWGDREGTEYLREIDEYHPLQLHPSQSQSYRRDSSDGYYPDLSGAPAGTGGLAYYPREMYDGYRYDEDQIPRSARGDSVFARDGQGKRENEKIKRHVCPVCDKRFNRPSSLQTHMSVHTGAKPYTCTRPGCGRKFSVSSNLRRHERTHGARHRGLPSASTSASASSHRDSSASINHHAYQTPVQPAHPAAYPYTHHQPHASTSSLESFATHPNAHAHAQGYYSSPGYGYATPPLANAPLASHAHAHPGDYAYLHPPAHAAYYAQPGAAFPERYPDADDRRAGAGESAAGGWTDETAAMASATATATPSARTNRSTLTAASGLALLSELRTPPTPELIALPPIVDVKLGQMGMGMSMLGM